MELKEAVVFCQSEQYLEKRFPDLEQRLFGHSLREEDPAFYPAAWHGTGSGQSWAADAIVVLISPEAPLPPPAGPEAPGVVRELLQGLGEQPAQRLSPQLLLWGERLEELGAGQVRGG